MPKVTPEEAPDEWREYWRQIELYEAWEKNEKNRLYRKRYYAEKTKQRQIAKMKELMKRYTHEARKYMEILD